MVGINNLIILDKAFLIKYNWVLKFNNKKMRKEIRDLIRPDHLSRERRTLKVVYPAYSKRCFFLREHVSKFVLEQGAVPLNPFMNFDYFFGDSIPRRVVYDANDQLIRIADSLWAIGPVADGVASEIMYAESVGKEVRYFKIEKDKNGMYGFKEIGEEEAEPER